MIDKFQNLNANSMMLLVGMLNGVYMYCSVDHGNDFSQEKFIFCWFGFGDFVVL